MSGIGRGDVRFPKDLPLVMQMTRPPTGVGRGLALYGNVSQPGPVRPPSTDTVEPPAAVASSFPPVASGLPPTLRVLGGRGSLPSDNNPRPGGHVNFRQALWNVNQPLRELEEMDSLVKSYIPGLHVPGQNFPVLPEPQSRAVNYLEVPPELIREYRNGSKHPVSAIEEFSKKLKIDVTFKETAVEDVSIARFGYFGNTCFIKGKKYPQGAGKTKKEAKTLAAKNAFDAILKDGFSIMTDADAKETDNKASGDGPNELKQPLTFSTQKNPAAIFNDYCVKKNIEANISLSDKPMPKGFECSISSRGKLIAVGYGNSKKDAKNKACDEALRVLMGGSSGSNSGSHFDKMASLVKAKLEQLQRQYRQKISDYSVLAAFVVMQFHGDEGRVVALATGSGCPRSSALTLDGRVVVDCHAEVLARRALVKWLVKQLNEAISSIQRHVPNDSVFVPNDAGNKFRLKDTVSFHMYISTAPCGDASAFPIDTKPFITPEENEVIHSGNHVPRFDHEDHGCLRTKGDEGQFTANVSWIPSNCTLSDEEDHEPIKFRTMSCSDKILKWNVLGLQGSIASHLLEPIYLNSITLGNNFEFGHIVRSVCCRVADEVNDDLPQGYQLRHPFVGRVSVYEPQPLEMTVNSGRCLNWSAADQDVEILSTDNGKTVPESPFHTAADPTASRLCKYGFGFRFRALAKLQCPQLLSNTTYHTLKAASSDYNTAKEALYVHMKKSGLGLWLKRAADLDMFSIE